MQMNWHAVHTRARHEKKVHERFGRNRIETFLPLVRKTSRWKDRRKVIEVPLFPGYLFVRVPAGRLFDVTNVAGVARLVGSERGEPWVVPGETVVALKKLVHSDAPVDPYPYLASGRQVRVVRGPLKGLEGLLQRRSGVLRVVVTVPMLGRSVAVEVDAEDLDLA